MNLWKSATTKLATALDWNVPRIVKRSKGDGAMIRRIARRRLKHEIEQEAHNDR